jgi:hypothetical protein
VDEFSLEGIISFDEALQRAWDEDGRVDAKTVQVTLGSADAKALHWGGESGLYYGIDWGGVCVALHGPLLLSPSPGPSPSACIVTTWGTAIDARTGAFVVGGA